MATSKLKIKLRCVYCHKVLRDNGTCQNEKCVRYVPPATNTENTGTNDAEK